MELYTRRSISECLGEAWTLLSTNLRRITKSLWLPTLLFALVVTVSSPITLMVQKHQAEGNLSSTDIILDTVCFIAFIVAMVYFEAKIFKLVNEQTVKFCIKRLVILLGTQVVIGIVLMIIAAVLFGGIGFAMRTGSIAPTVGLVLLGIAMLIYIVLTILIVCPTCYPYTKYMIEPDMKIKGYWKAYKIGWKNMGTIIGFALLCTLIVIIAQTLISLPGTIALIAVKFSLDGVANGDPSGLPSSFPYILAVTAFISSLVTSILIIWTTFAQYYLYASIEAKERETLPTPPVRAGE